MTDTSSLLKRFVLVGAEYGDNQGLGSTDFAIFRHCLKQLVACGMSYQVDSVDVVNIDPNQGGRDFLKEEILADVIILCNIPHIETHEDAQDRLHRMYEARANVGHYLLSDKHWGDGIWRQKIHSTGAKVVFSSGVDSMELTDISSPRFCSVTSLRRQSVVIPFLVDGAYAESLPIHNDMPPGQLEVMNLADTSDYKSAPQQAL